MTRIVIAGAAGRMGHALIGCAGKMDEVELVGAVDRDDHSAIGEDSGVMAALGENGIPLAFDLQEVLSQGDVMIDFTLHDAVPGNVAIAAELGCPVVIGTTGLSEKETQVVRSAAEKIPIIWAPNMSLGVNLLFACLKKAGAVLGQDYKVTIEETHHIHKKDAPSGTALRLGEKVAEGLGVDFAENMVHDPEGEQGLDPEGKILIQSYREGEVVGDHTASFVNDGERIEFSHNAFSRDAFAMGALRAAQWVIGREPRIYDMQDVLGL